MTAIDVALPHWDRREQHRVAARGVAPDALLRAAEELTWGEVPVFRAIMLAVGLGRTRLPPGQRVLSLFLDNGFAVLAQTDTELLVGGIEPTSRGPLRVVGLGEAPTAVAFRDFSDPGHVKVVMNFRYAEGDLTTETRVLATDTRSRRLFAAYWCVIRGGSGVIRRVWLRALRNRAAGQRAAAASG